LVLKQIHMDFRKEFAYLLKTAHRRQWEVFMLPLQSKK
jgi:hypothetical protein